MAMMPRMTSSKKDSPASCRFLLPRRPLCWSRGMQRWSSTSSLTQGANPPTLRYGQPHPSTHPHLLTQGEITPGTTADEYALRRSNFINLLPDKTVAIIPSHPELMMSYDIPYSFRQQTDFYYLSGYQEPDALLVLRKQSNGSHFTMFVRPRDPAREIWDGSRSGVEGALSFFGADEAFPIDQLEVKLPGLLHGMENVAFHPNIHLEFSNRVFSLIEPEKTASPQTLLQELRLIKSPSEVNIMRRSTEISAQSFCEIMRATRPGILEGQLAALYEYECRKRGAQRLAYPPVFASGIHANTLHYISNDDRMKDGQLLLVDAGGEYNMFSSDITRTWPVNGKFTAAQRDLYNTVLDVQKKCIAMCVVNQGMSLGKLHQASVQMLGSGLRKLGIHVGNVQKYYPHSIGHWVGMDVHDVHDVPSKPLEPGMLITVEPGLYIPDEPHIPKELRGQGIRIEDDVLITENGPEILTRGCPKETDEIEATMRDLRPL